MRSFLKKLYDSPARFAVVGFGMVAALVGGNLTLAYLVDTHNQKNLEDDIAHIDRVGGNVFRSPAACMAQGNDEISCHLSQEIAQSKTRERGVQIVYNTASECAARHGPACEKLTGVYFNGYTYEYPVYYKPLTVAWQAARDDIKRAVPLYSAPEAGKGYRSDGALIALPDVE